MTKRATTDHPVHELIASRWSPYAFSDRPVETSELCSLFEAARWTASSYNEQPWSYLVATKDDPQQFEQMLSCLLEGNQGWANAAPVLAIAVASLKFSRNEKPNRVAVYDLGAAAASLTFEASARGLCVHQMAGIMPDKARVVYAIPDGYEPVAGLAIGYAGSPDQLPESMAGRDTAERTRKPLREFVYQRRWGQASAITD